ncbi:hypothetical protein M9H77_21013 [Catharanthus roseus]|uniref:Uncharacterized protein n=1 Tax=Catharanthus roseus TaxID=4058 RepID=A0ACC0ALC6_CATRO|nr:hypothetical protein M9H77_21013 [Catharanthus roseus]
MKKERSNHYKIKALKALKTYVLVRDVLMMHPNLYVSISVVLFQKRPHPIFLYKEIGHPFLETGRPVFFFTVKNITVTHCIFPSKAHLVTLFFTHLSFINIKGLKEERQGTYWCMGSRYK